MLASLTVLLLLSSATQFSAAKTDAITQVSVLVLVPYPDFNPNSGWSNGIELLPAARIAAREINNRADILPGYNLSLAEASSDACGCNNAPIGLSNFVRYALSNKMSNKAIAVTGLVCSTVTEAVSSIAGRPEVDVVQLSLSNSPLLRDTSKYKRLWHVLPSSRIFIDTTISLIKHFSWNKITLLYSEANVLTESTTDAFIDILSNTTIQYELIGIRSSPIFIHKALDLIEAESNRIIFTSISSLDDLSHLMCEAFSRGLTWPCYGWIFQLLTYSEVLLLEQSFCSQHALIQAMNMSLILNYRLDNNNNNDVLVSGKTYGQFRKEYLDELQKIKSEDFVQEYLSAEYVFSDDGNLYSNPMYDEIWGLGLAINSSLGDIERSGLSLNDYSYNNTQLTNIIQEHLTNVRFNGAVGEIDFNEEPSLPIYIHQVRDNVSLWIGDYIQKSNNLTLWNMSGVRFPQTNFTYHHDLIPLPVAVYFYTEGSLIFIFITITMSLMIFLWKTPEVKAASPTLTMLTFCGSYMCLASGTLGIYHQSSIIDPFIYTILCNIIHRLSAYGINLMVSTVLVKLIRISHVFNHFGYTSKLWRDHYLFVFILIIAGLVPGIIDIILIFTTTGLFKHYSAIVEGEHCSIKVIKSHCTVSSLFVWKIFSIGLTLLPMALLIPFSICTRKVQMRNFKDTKKTLAFVFCTVLVSGLLTPFMIKANAHNDENKYAIYQATLMHILVLLTIGFFVATKVYPALCYRKVSKIATVTSSIDAVSEIVHRSRSNLTLRK